MSKEAIETALGRALLDDAFREALFAAPYQALEDFDLTLDEKTRLQHLDSELLDELAQMIQTRLGRVKHPTSAAQK